MNLGITQNAITTLPQLDSFRYENIFKLYQTDAGQYFYNILSEISLPQDLDKNLFYTVVINQKTPWTVVSYGAYGTIELWWLIVLANGIKNPLILPESGTLKILKGQYVRPVITQLTQLIQ